MAQHVYTAVNGKWKVFNVVMWRNKKYKYKYKHLQLACLWLALNDGNGNTIQSKSLQFAVYILHRPLCHGL